MDDFERLVLRKKKKVVSEKVTIDVSLLEEMKNKGLLDKDMVVMISKERTAHQKTSRLFEFLSLCHHHGCFELFCTCLAKDYPDISKDLQAEVRQERGNLIIDDDVMTEAGIIVHSKFGASKRMSETDKKEIQDLVAVKVQVAKEDWKVQVQELQDDLQYYKQLNKSKDSMVKEWDNSLKKFTKSYKDQLTSRSHDMVTTKTALESAVDDEDGAAQFAFKLRYVLDRCAYIMKEQVLLKDERQKCLEVLHIKDESAPLDNILQTKIEEMPNKLEKAVAETKSQEKVIKKLKKQLERLEHELEDKEAQDVTLRGELAEKTERVHALQERIHSFEIEKLNREASDYEAKKKAAELRQRRASTGRVHLGLGIRKFNEKLAQQQKICTKQK